MRLAGTIGAIFGALSLIGCTRTVLLEHRFRAPIPEDRFAALEFSECIARCEPLYSKDRDRYGACLAGCPGIEVTENAPCESTERPDEVWCYELVRTEEILDQERTLLVADALVTVMKIAVEASRDEEPKRSRKKVRRAKRTRRPHRVPHHAAPLRL